MPIEELGRDYLCRYNAIRRHTIGNNFDNDQNNYIVKSTECLLMLVENNENLAKNGGKSNVNINENNFFTDLKRSSNDSDLINLNKTNNPNFGNNSLTIQYFDSNNQLHNNNNINNNNNNYNNNQQQLAFNLMSYNYQDKNRFQEMNSIDSKYLYPFQSKEDTMNNNKIKTLKQSNDLGSKKYLHQHRVNNYNKYQRQKHNRLFNGTDYMSTQHYSQQQQQQQQQQQHSQQSQESSLSLTSRRASDGGSNISLFNQFYSLRSIKNNQQQSSANNNGSDCQNQDNNLNVSNNLGAALYQSRGSITSGIPVFSASTQLTESSRPESPNNQINNSNSPNFSSEDDDSNLKDSNNVMKCQRKSSRSRHEPYIESVGSSSLSKSSYGRPVSPFSIRKREQSFSGSNSPSVHNFSDSFNRMHRGSEPNQFDVIYANR